MLAHAHRTHGRRAMRGGLGVWRVRARLGSAHLGLTLTLTVTPNPKP